MERVSLVRSAKELMNENKIEQSFIPTVRAQGLCQLRIPLPRSDITVYFATYRTVANVSRKRGTTFSSLAIAYLESRAGSRFKARKSPIICYTCTPKRERESFAIWPSHPDTGKRKAHENTFLNLPTNNDAHALLFLPNSRSVLMSSSL